MTKIHDVAKAAGVSTATVSKAVNGRYGVSPQAIERVMAAVDELGYESSLVASSMRSHRTGVIGVLVADFEPFSAEILKGVSAALRRSRYDLLAYSGSRQADGAGWERRSLSRLSGTLIDGAIMVTPTVVTASTEIPVVSIDPHTGPADLPSVESDSLGGALQATRHLLELGHRRIGFLAGRPDQLARLDRLLRAPMRLTLGLAAIAIVHARAVPHAACHSWALDLSAGSSDRKHQQVAGRKVAAPAPRLADDELGGQLLGREQAVGLG